MIRCDVIWSNTFCFLQNCLTCEFSCTLHAIILLFLLLLHQAWFTLYIILHIATSTVIIIYYIINYYICDIVANNTWYINIPGINTNTCYIYHSWPSWPGKKNIRYLKPGIKKKRLSAMLFNIVTIDAACALV